MIKFKDVNFAYGTEPVLRNVSFELGNTESLVIMGPSGSGKSTILRLILGLVCPQDGEVLIEGRDICYMNEKDKRGVRKKIGMVFQAGALFDSLTVGENVGYYLFEHTQLPADEIEIRVREMLGFVGLDSDEVIDKLPEELSGGMQRRVAIARALLSTDPKMMLFDEPTTGLDPRATQNVLNLMIKLREKKEISTITVTHQIADAFVLSNRFLVIHEGTVAFDGTMEQLRDNSDSRVVNFLNPFRIALEGVLDRNFVER